MSGGVPEKHRDLLRQILSNLGVVIGISPATPEDIYRLLSLIRDNISKPILHEVLKTVQTTTTNTQDPATVTLDGMTQTFTLSKEKIVEITLMVQSQNNEAGKDCVFYLFVDGSWDGDYWAVEDPAQYTWHPSCFKRYKTLSAGEHTVTWKWRVDGGEGQVVRRRLSVIELG